MSEELDQVFAYHQATKHSFTRMAPGPKTMDWGNEPRPFRRFRGADLIELERPEPRPGEGPEYDQALEERGVPPRPLGFDTVSQLLFDSLAISAWRRAGGAAWALRTNPSSGNLHPTEGYLICGPVFGLFDRPAVSHYAPREHALEVRCRLSEKAWRDMASGLPEGTVLVGFSSIPWRECWKYGERAFRYLHLNLGHALAATSLASAALGWRATLLEEVGTEELAYLLGVAGETGAEAEIPDCLVAVHPQGSAVSGFDLSEKVLAELRGVEWQGKPDRLSPDAVDWPLVAGMAKATAKPPGEVAEDLGGMKAPPGFARPPASLRNLIRNRRSAIVMDPAFSMERDDLFGALCRTLPGSGRFPNNLFAWRPQVHLAAFVHRVLGLDRGLYLLVRNPDHEESLRSSLSREFDWKTPQEAPPGFYRLATGDFRELSRALSCGQKIASEGCFSLAMIARFRPNLEERGPWFYNRLLWECGIVGQTLYLEAEATGLAGCGIGCFFDDAVSSALGLKGPEYQSLYHFAVGREIPLQRIETLPAYPAPDR
ncbi:SagB/ThcOx family dehydrogenase [Methanocrinis sp.]|uniref:SagB/ThcOx family dehydrogenase n=1 Tax=Methanocrinis sp. TaxID=3101522 RepID=UPI003D0CBB63